MDRPQRIRRFYRLSGVYALLHRLGYRCLMPRPRHPKADSQAQEAFKKSRGTNRDRPGGTS